MDCASCAAKIDTAVRRLSGVTDVSVSVTNGAMTVNHDGTAKSDEIAGKVTALGYKTALAKTVVPGAGSAPKATGPTKPQPWWRSKKGQMMLACGGGLVAAYIVGHLYPSIALWAFTAAMLIGLVPIAKRAYMAAINGTPFSIEMLMTIAAIGAMFIGATEEAAAVVFLFLVGELLEGVAAGKARASIQSLTALVPKTAFLERNGATTEVAADSLAVGDVISVRPGDRMPADGEILTGESAVDEAPVTGESTPVGKAEGDTVLLARSMVMVCCGSGSRLPRRTIPSPGLCGWSRKRRKPRRRPNVSSIVSRPITRRALWLWRRSSPFCRRLLRVVTGMNGFTRALRSF